jgi:hypothetical protein
MDCFTDNKEPYNKDNDKKDNHLNSYDIFTHYAFLLY